MRRCSRREGIIVERRTREAMLDLWNIARLALRCSISGTMLGLLSDARLVEHCSAGFAMLVSWNIARIAMRCWTR